MKLYISSEHHKSVPNTFLLLTVAAMLFICVAATAQDKSAAIDSIFSWATPTAPGCVCAVSQNGKVIFSRAYGLANLERNIPLSNNSVFDIGSTHKQFVAASVLLLAKDGKLSLTDDIRKYFPEMEQTTHKVTIDHLLTHTSGIRDWTGLLSLAAGNPDVLKLIVQQKELNFVPGEEWSYSNSGYVLAKEIVARVSGMSFGEFAHKRLFEPLGMKSTLYSVNMRDSMIDRALAYEKEGTGFRISMRLDNNRGGGGILSTASDLLTWNNALATGKLGKFVTEKLHEPARLNSGRELVYAHGLFVDPYRGGIPMVAHSGGSAGYSSWLGRFPQQNLSIVVLCNVEPISATGFSYRIANLFLPLEGVKEVEGDGPPPAIPEDMNVSNKTGLYLDDHTGDFLNLVAERGYFRIAGGPGLVPVTSDRFRRWGSGLQFMSQDKFEINFLSPDEFELRSMEGKTTRYRRTKPYSYSQEDLKQFAGQYESKEIGSILNVHPGENGLIVALAHVPERKLEFQPISPDTFIWNKRMIVRFRRSTSGAVTSLEYTNPVLNKAGFLRIR